MHLLKIQRVEETRLFFVCWISCWFNSRNFGLVLLSTRIMKVKKQYAKIISQNPNSNPMSKLGQTHMQWVTEQNSTHSLSGSKVSTLNRLLLKFYQLMEFHHSMSWSSSSAKCRSLEGRRLVKALRLKMLVYIFFDARILHQYCLKITIG